MTAASDIVEVEAPGALVPSKPADFAKPLVDATHTAYEKVAGGVEWYFEHWVDLVEEIKAEKAAHLESLNVPDIMAALPEAKVASDIPGRVRLRLPLLKGQKPLSEQCAEILRGVPGIIEVQVSPVTGSVLAFYDKQTLPNLEALLEAVASASGANDGA